MPRASEDGNEDGAIAMLIRDSAIVLGGAVGLLYVVSHVYGLCYVTAFGIGAGFQGEGLGNLAMLTPHSVVLLGVFGWFVFSALCRQRRLPSAITPNPATSDQLKTGHLVSFGDVVHYFVSEPFVKLAAL